MLLFAFLTSSAFAQGVVTGSVTNAATGSILEGARVVLEGTGREMTTDSLGSYRFDNVAAGSVSLAVYYTGLTTERATITVSAVKTTIRAVLPSLIFAVSR